jgi:SAM-dependent methyltransferase
LATKDKRTLREHWDGAAPDWVRWARTPGHDDWYVRLNRPAFMRLVPAPGRLTLDLACGEGRLTRELYAAGHRVVGLDYSPVMTRAFREAGLEPPVVRADAARLPFANASFDLVVAFMSLFNLDDIGGAVAEVARTLRPRGHFCFAVIHPFMSAGAFDSSEADAPFRLTRSYMEPSSKVYVVERQGIRMEFRDEHRPLSFYFDALERAGLLVEALREPVPDAEFALQPGVGHHRRLPLYLHVRAVKRG